MTLRPEFTLGHSPYNAFLFAEVGEEHAGVSLTVLSALTRLGFDPWQEAARLSDLPRDTAARAFAVTIAMLPEGDWKAEELGGDRRPTGGLAAGAQRQGGPACESGRCGGTSTRRRLEDETGIGENTGLGRARRRPALFRGELFQHQQPRAQPARAAGFDAAVEATGFRA